LISWTIMNDWDFCKRSFTIIEVMVNVFKLEGNARTIMFSDLVGALLLFIWYSKETEGL
jgi:hypothetical protein